MWSGMWRIVADVARRVGWVKSVSKASAIPLVPKDRAFAEQSVWMCKVIVRIVESAILPVVAGRSVSKACVVFLAKKVLQTALVFVRIS